MHVRPCFLGSRVRARDYLLFFLRFPFRRGEAGLVVTPQYGYFCKKKKSHWYLLLAFSHHFSSSSASLRSLFTQSSHLSCDLPRFLQPSCSVISRLSF